LPSNKLIPSNSFADREFYQDWFVEPARDQVWCFTLTRHDRSFRWNSTTWDEFARKWNKPVHVRAFTSTIIRVTHDIFLPDLPSSPRLCVYNVDVSAVQDFSDVLDVLAFGSMSRDGHGGSDEKDQASQKLQAIVIR
jgi:hypothetical protein